MGVVGGARRGRSWGDVLIWQENMPTGLGMDDSEAEEIERLVALRADRRVIDRQEYEASLRRMGKAPTRGRVGALRRKGATVAPAGPPASSSVTAEALIGIASSSFLGYFRRVVVPRYPDLTFSSWRRRVHRQTDPAVLRYVKAGQVDDVQALTR